MEIKPMENVYTDDYIGLIKLKTRVDVLIEILERDKFMNAEDICLILGYKLSESEENAEENIE